jgi:hypothetical protein
VSHEFRTLEMTDALLALAMGPADDATRYDEYTLGIGHTRHYFQHAVVAHHPGPGSPSHLLIWTRDSAHCFEYHQVNWCCSGDLR